jgi:hypothetical protein
MKMPESLSTYFLASCGIDCAACYARLRLKNACPGCLSKAAGKPEHCRSCSIKACAKNRGLNRCYGCSDFPCSNIRRIDKRYLTRYGVGLIENGRKARAMGLREFMAAERKRWTCLECGGILNQHKRVCSECLAEA